MSTAIFGDYLERMGVDFEIDEENNAIDIQVETQDGMEYTITLVAARSTYTLFVSPLVEIGEECEITELYQKLLELSDRCRYVKLCIDGDGDIKISADGFTRLDAYGQFRRRVEAIMKTIDKHGEDIANLADGDLF